MALRTLHIIHNLERAGAQVNLLNLLGAENIGADQHAVFAWKAGGPLEEPLRREGHAVRVAKRANYLGVLSELLAFSKTFQPGLAHAHMSDSAFWADIVSRRMGAHLIITFHDGTRLIPELRGLKGRLRRRILKISSARAACLIAIREPLVQKICDELPVAPARVRYLPPCVRPAKASPRAGQNTRQRSDHDALRIISLGRYIAIKGQEQLIRAVAQLHRGATAVECDIIGDGPLRSDLENLARDVAPANVIRITGPTDDPAAHLAQADIAVSTSHYEGASLFLLEAMAAGVPVIASDAPGNRDLIRHEIDGLLYALHNIDALAACIRRLGDECELRRRLAENAFEKIQRFYSVDASYFAHRALYEAAMAR